MGTEMEFDCRVKAARWEDQSHLLSEEKGLGNDLRVLLSMKDQLFVWNDVGMTQRGLRPEMKENNCHRGWSLPIAWSIYVCVEATCIDIADRFLTRIHGGSRNGQELQWMKRRNHAEWPDSPSNKRKRLTSQRKSNIKSRKWGISYNIKRVV